MRISQVIRNDDPSQPPSLFSLSLYLVPLHPALGLSSCLRTASLVFFQPLVSQAPFGLPPAFASPAHLRHPPSSSSSKYFLPFHFRPPSGPAGLRYFLRPALTVSGLSCLPSRPRLARTPSPPASVLSLASPRFPTPHPSVRPTCVRPMPTSAILLFGLGLLYSSGLYLFDLFPAGSFLWPPPNSLHPRADTLAPVCLSPLHLSPPVFGLRSLPPACLFALYLRPPSSAFASRPFFGRFIRLESEAAAPIPRLRPRHPDFSLGCASGPVFGLCPPPPTRGFGSHLRPSASVPRPGTSPSGSALYLWWASSASALCFRPSSINNYHSHRNGVRGGSSTWRG